MSSWYVYILRCADHSLYTGITLDLARRLHEHNNTRRGAAYTRARRPVRLVYHERAPTRSAASRREYALRKMSKKEKEIFISRHGKR